MARRKKKAAESDRATADVTPGDTPVTEPTAKAAGEPREPVTGAAVSKPAHAADPSATMSVGLGGHPGGPTMHLLRSWKFHQMQVRFDGEQPDEKYLAMLAKAGWRDRTEAEGVWTKQIDREARWQSVAQVEREFKAVADAIRTDKGLGPVLGGLVVA